jgi:energy-coupling factor transporter ATP-binding protein EcfA2
LCKVQGKRDTLCLPYSSYIIVTVINNQTVEDTGFLYASPMTLKKFVGATERAIFTGVVDNTKYTFHLTFTAFEVYPPEPLLQKDPVLSAVYVPVIWTFKSVDQYDPKPGTDRLSIRNIDYMVHRLRSGSSIEDVVHEFFPNRTVSSEGGSRARAYFDHPLYEDDVIFFEYLSQCHQQLLSIITFVMYARVYFRNTIVLLDCPFATLDSWSTSKLWHFLEEQCNKYNIQMVISATSIPDYLSINPATLVNLNRVHPDYILQSDTPENMVESIEELMSIDQLVTFDIHRRVIIFSNKKLKNKFLRQQDTTLLLLTVVICDSDPAEVITKLVALNNHIKSSGESLLNCFVVADHSAGQLNEIETLNVQWYFVENEEVMEKCLKGLGDFITKSDLPRCAVCFKRCVTPRSCSRCKQVNFCSLEHQDASKHKTICTDK